MLVFLLLPLLASAAPLRAQAPIPVPGSGGAFDFMAADSANDRILAAHRGAGTLEVIDLKSGKLLKTVPVGAAQGVAVDTAGKRYFAGNEADKSVAVVSSEDFHVLGTVKVSGPVDAIAFDPKNGLLYAAEDDGKRLWVIDPAKLAVVGEVKIPGVPEVLEYDAGTDRLYVNIKDKNEVARVNPGTASVDAEWPTAPAESPHGLTLDAKLSRAYVAGGNGRLVAIDLKTGKVLSNAEIAAGVDQIAFDASQGMIYSAGKGFVSVTRTSPGALTSLPAIASPKGAHTIAVDSKRHEVWVCFADAKKQSFLQRFSK